MISCYLFNEEGGEEGKVSGKCESSILSVGEDGVVVRWEKEEEEEEEEERWRIKRKKFLWEDESSRLSSCTFSSSLNPSGHLPSADMIMVCGFKFAD